LQAAEAIDVQRIAAVGFTPAPTMVEKRSPKLDRDIPRHARKLSDASATERLVMNCLKRPADPCIRRCHKPALFLGRRRADPDAHRPDDYHVEGARS
jgi:hypothetical protein